MGFGVGLLMSGLGCPGGIATAVFAVSYHPLAFARAIPNASISMAPPA
jgi:hypothetical protein